MAKAIKVIETLRLRVAATGPVSAVPLLELRDISKEFPGVKALDGVSFPVWPGEVHMLLGENGAGKSSLMKVLCGAYRADSGEFSITGVKRPRSRRPRDAQRLGIAVIFQELSWVRISTSAQNIFLGREPGRSPARGTIDLPAYPAGSRKILN